MARPLNYGEGSVFQRKDGRWIGTLEAGYTDKGTRRRVSVTASTEAACRRRLRDRRAELERLAGAAPSNAMRRKTVKAWTDEWLTQRAREKRPKTYAADELACRSLIVPVIGGKRLIDLTPSDVRAVVNRHRDAGGASSSVLRTQRVLVKILRDAAAEGYPVAPGIFAMKAWKPPKSDRRALDLTEALAVLEQAAQLPHGVRYYIGFLQGLRSGEVLGLTWEAIDFENRTMDVSWQLQAIPYKVARDRESGFRLPDDADVRHLVGRFHLTRPKTSAGWRVIPLVPQAAEALRLWRDSSPPNPHGLVFARTDGWPIDRSADEREFTALQKAAGIKHPTRDHYVVHEMRNTTATILVELGIDPVTITAILGHSGWATSLIYTRSSQSRMREALDQVGTRLALD